MDQNLRIKAFGELAMLSLILSALLFVSAGTLNYWQAWLFLIVFSAATTLSTLSLMKNDPALLKRRLHGGPIAEKRGAQKVIMWCVSFLFIALFIVSGIDHRFGWSHVPSLIVLIGEGMIALSFVVYDLVFRDNSFAGSTIQLAKGQTVISTGPYHLVRHPMYAGGIVFLFSIPIALGSLWALLIFLLLLPILLWRIVDEEQFLNKQLPGYSEYCHKVKYRLLPWIY